MRAVVDTTAFVGAVLNRDGRLGELIRGIGDGRYTLVYSDAIFDGLEAVLHRPRLLRAGLDIERVRILLSLVVAFGERIVPTETIAACRDPKDDKFLEAATSGAADVIVSGDGDLLGLDPFRGIPIRKPAVFLSMLGEPAP